MQTEDNNKKSINRILDVVEKIASGDFSYKIPISEEGNEFDALAAGINMLSEELEDVTINQQKQNEALLFMLEDLDSEKEKTDNAILQIKESEERLETILKSIQAGVLLIDYETHEIVDANNKAEEIIGISKDKIVGKKCHKFVCPACEGSCPISDLGQKVDNSERELITSNGEIKSVLKTVDIIFIKNRKYLIESFVDISDRIRFEKELKISKDRYELTIKGADLGTWDWDIESGNVLTNDMWTGMIGYEPGELKVTKDVWLSLLHPDDLPKVGEVLEAHLSGKSNLYEVEFRIKHKNGSWVWVYANGELVERKKDGTPVRMVGIHQDISKRKKIEEDLKKSEDKFKRVMQNSPDAIVIVDLKGNVIDTNEAGEKLSGYTKDEWLKLNIADLHPKDQLQQAIKSFERVIKEGRDSYDSILLKKDKTTTPIAISSSLIELEEKKYVLTLAKDISERKKSQEKLEKYARNLEEANKDIDSFAYSVSHDLRSPLRAINGFSQALLDSYGEKIDSDMKHYLDRIREGAIKMGVLIDDLLRFSRTTRVDIKYEEVDVNKIVNSIVSEYNDITKNRKIDFEIDKLYDVKADKTMVEVIFNNLIGNSVKYTSKNDKAKIKIGSKIKNDFVEFYVKDNGAGFDMKYVDKLFGPFQRLHTDKEFEGTGIGLATVKKLVSKHGGRIWPEAETDKGATFYFTLPHNIKNIGEK